MTKYDLANQMFSQIESVDFSEHVQKHFVSEEEAQELRLGRTFSIFTGKFTWSLLQKALLNWAEGADKVYEDILSQKEDVKEYRHFFNTLSVCGKVFPAAGKVQEVNRFALFFVVFRNVKCGKVEYEIRLKTVYPVAK